MFMFCVSVCLCIVLVLAGGATLYMGVFRAHRQELSLGRKAACGVASYGFSAVAWYLMYGVQYLGW